MSIEDQGSHDHTDDEVSLGIAPEKGNQNWNGCSTSDGSKRDISPLPYDPCKDEEFNQD
jgi:hypothetical protein